MDEDCCAPTQRPFREATVYQDFSRGSHTSGPLGTKWAGKHLFRADGSGSPHSAHHRVPRKSCQPRTTASFEKGSRSCHGTGGESRGDWSPPSRAQDWSAGSCGSRDSLAPQQAQRVGGGSRGLVGGGALARSGASPPFWDPLSGSQDQVPLCATHSPEQWVTPGGGSGRRGPRGLCPREHAVPRAPTWDFEPAPLSRTSCRLLPGHSGPSQAPSSM